MKAKPDAAEPAEIQVMPRVGVIEDEPYVRTIIETYLSANRFIVRSLRSGQEVQQAVANGEIDLLLLDLGLPGEDGISILHAVRTVSRLPVVIVSGRKETVSIATGLDAGADDYVAKPFHLEEVLARLRALLRRSAGHAKSELNCGPVRLDTRTGRVTIDGNPVKLTSHEYRLLSYLMHHAGRVVSRTELVEHLYDQDFDRDSNTIEVFVGRIRKKLGVDIIQTVRGLGYLLTPPDVR